MLEARKEALESLRNPGDSLAYLDILARFKKLVTDNYWHSIGSLENTTIGCFCRGAQSFCVAEILTALFIEKYSYRIHLQDFLDTQTRVVQLIPNIAELLFLKSEPDTQKKKKRSQHQDGAEGGGEGEEEEESAGEEADVETVDSPAEIFTDTQKSAQVMGLDVSWMNFRESAWWAIFWVFYSEAFVKAVSQV